MYLCHVVAQAELGVGPVHAPHPLLIVLLQPSQAVESVGNVRQKPAAFPLSKVSRWARTTAAQVPRITTHLTLNATTRSKGFTRPCTSRP